MTQQSHSQGTPDPVAEAFVERVRAFYTSLPPEERQMLEQVFVLAEMVTSRDADVSGYGIKIDSIKINDLSPSLSSSMQLLNSSWGVSSSAGMPPGSPNPSDWGPGKVK